ncbi:MAG TPA: hypothetical protein EYP04_06645, partial [Anaerolineae bacterium]|nr:hypothetical protein [Anaerolineae bacterium]
MAGVITALRFQKRNARRVNVYLDGHYAFSLAAVDAARLKHGQVLTDEEIARLRAADEVQTAYEQALRFLRYRPRSQTEIRRHLGKKGVSDSVIAAVMERLIERGYVDDLEFARFWVRERETFRPRSPYALRHELRMRGVDDAIISQVLAELDPEDSAYRAALSKVRRWRDLDYQTF